MVDVRQGLDFALQVNSSLSGEIDRGEVYDGWCEPILMGKYVG